MGKNILIVSAECAPYQKVGGLADANADFSIAYKNVFKEDNITLILPLYNCNNSEKYISLNGYTLEKTGLKYNYKYGINKSHAEIYKVKNPYNNIPTLLIYSEAFSKYNEPYQGDIFKNSSAFSQAVLAYLDNETDNEKLPDIIQTTDFPVFIKEYNFTKRKTLSPQTLHIIHNAGTAYQSQTDPLQAIFCLGSKTDLKNLLSDKDFQNLCLLLYKKYKKCIFYNIEEACRYISENYFQLRQDKSNLEILDILNLAAMKYFEKYIDKNGMFNPIKKHISTVDYWITDSPTYYKELLENEKYSGDLFDVLKSGKTKSCAVLAGIAPERYSPENSTNIKYNFDENNFLENKLKNKKYLLENFSRKSIQGNDIDTDLFISKEVQIKGFLNSSSDAPLIFMSSRADIHQKGIDIAFYAVEDILKTYDAQVIFSFPNAFQNDYIKSFIEYLSSKKEFLGKFLFIDAYVPIERYCAGSDLFLMPSRFEPCGFSQLIAMRFGCIPVVCATGGLNDTIIDFNQNKNIGNGFKTNNSFYDCNSPEQYRLTLLRALKTFKNPDNKYSLIKNALNYDSSWNEYKIRTYNKVYENILNCKIL